MGKHGKIVVIDDDPDDQEIIGDAFQQLGVENEIHFCSDCNEAYNYLMSLKEKPFLIICDINLPKMNGIELKHRIDDTDHLRRLAIPFIFLTTSDSKQTINEAYRISNLQGYFKKANTMVEIKHRLQSILTYWTEALHPDT